MADAIENALPALGPRGALDIITAATATTLWPVAHPPQAFAEATPKTLPIAPTWALDFSPTLICLLTATCIGLMTKVANTDIEKR